MLRQSRSELLVFRQCERRLWLELRQPGLRRDDGGSQAAFAAGHQVGELARRLYDPDGRGVRFEVQAEGVDTVLARRTALLDGAALPIMNPARAATRHTIV